MTVLNSDKSVGESFDLALNPRTMKQYTLSRIGAILIGVSIPIAASSFTAMAVSIILGLIFALLSPGRKIVLKHFIRFVFSPLGVSLVILFLAWLPGVLNSIEPERSAEVWGRMVAFVLVASVFYLFLSLSNLRKQSVLRSLIISGSISTSVGLIAVYFYSPILSIYRLEGLDLIDAGSVLKYYGSVEGCLCLVALWAGFYLGGIWRILGILKSIAGIIFIISVDSDAGLLALIVGSICAGIFLLETSLLKIKLHGFSIFIIIFLALIVLCIILFKLPHTPDLSSISSKTFEGVLTPTLSADILDFHRQHIWAFTLDAALNSPIIGHGINVSNYLPGADIIISQFNQAFIPGHPHNWFLEVFLETGSIGLLALIAALLILLINWARLSKKELFSSTVGISIFASFWASSMLNFSIWASWWQAVFLILTVIVFSSSGTNRISNKMQQKK